MSWIREEESTLPGLLKAMSINPQVLETFRAMSHTIFFGASALTRVQEETIALVVCVENKCRYATFAHATPVRDLTGDPALVSALMYDYTKAPLDPQTRGILDFAVKLTRQPGTMQEEDVKRLRALGLSDEQVLSVVLITCLYNFTPRLLGGLGVPLPPERRAVVEQWLTGPARQLEWLMREKR